MISVCVPRAEAVTLCRKNDNMEQESGHHKGSGCYLREAIHVDEKKLPSAFATLRNDVDVDSTDVAGRSHLSVPIFLHTGPLSKSVVFSRSPWHILGLMEQRRWRQKPQFASAAAAIEKPSTHIPQRVLQQRCVDASFDLFQPGLASLAG